MDLDLNLNILSDMDKNMSVLAHVKTDILYRKYFNKPISEATAAKFALCCSQLPLCDRLRVDSQANTIAAMDIHRVEQYRKDKAGGDTMMILGTITIGLMILL